MRRFEYKVVDTGTRVEEELNKLGAEGWQVVGVTTGELNLPVPPLSGAVVAGDQTGAVEPAEVAADERVSRLPLVCDAFGEPEVPLAVLALRV